MFGLLQIYDADDKATVNTAGSRGGVDRSVPVTGGVAGFVNAMKLLVKDGVPYNRVIVETHGGAGHIKFNDQSVFDITLKGKLAGNYVTLFPIYTRMYFNGCDVADTNLGWEFLEAAGEVFLKSGGGRVFAHTSPGYAYPSWVPIVGSHTVHFSGDTRYVEIGIGGRVIRRGTLRADGAALGNHYDVRIGQRR